MYDSHLYKTIALRQLKGRWTTPVIATIITLFSTSITENAINITQAQTTYFPMRILFMIIAINIFVNGSLAIANALMYIALSHDTKEFSLQDYIQGFSKIQKGILMWLYTRILLALWLLLFIIPGIIKAIAYFAAPYIIAENPSISIVKAVKLSVILTRGYKADIFWTIIGFLPWFLLSLLTCGVGFFWLIPYINMTMTNVFHALKQQALQTQILQSVDFR